MSISNFQKQSIQHYWGRVQKNYIFKQEVHLKSSELGGWEEVGRHTVDRWQGGCGHHFVSSPGQGELADEGMQWLLGWSFGVLLYTHL